MEYLKDSLDTGQTENELFSFKSIKAHRASSPPPDSEYLGSSYNLPIDWDTGEITWEPLTNIMVDVNHCGKFKARLMTDGHLTKEPNDRSCFFEKPKIGYVPC